MRPRRLDLAQKSRPARRRRLAALLAAALLALALPRLAAAAVLLPGQLYTAAAQAFCPRYLARLEAAEAEAAALRRQAAQAAALRQENQALRTLAGAGRLPGDVSVQPCTLTALLPGGFEVGGQALRAGQALLDDAGRLAGTVRRAGRYSALADAAGTPGCRLACGAADTAGTLTARGGRLWLCGLPRRSGLAAGEPVVTLGSGSCPAGLWVGRLAAAPAADAGGLTCSAPLTDTAQPCARYFAAG